MHAELTLNVELPTITIPSVPVQLGILETHLNTAHLNRRRDQKPLLDQEAVIQTHVDHIQYAKSLVLVLCVTVSQGTLESHQTVDQNVRLVPSVPWILPASIINV
jgi:hypothetical protein